DYAFARYYSSPLGRFLSTDPLGGSIGSLQSHNAYAYVVNNPSNFVDPSGQYLVGPQGTPGGGGTDPNNPFDPTSNGSVWSAALYGNLITLYGPPFYGSFAPWAVFNSDGISFAAMGWESNIEGIFSAVLGSFLIGGGSTPGNGSTAGAGGGNSSGNDVPLGLDIANCPSVGGRPGCHQIWNGATNMVWAGTAVVAVEATATVAIVAGPAAVEGYLQ